ncbi:MAG: helix-turn-helix domain-containing protein [Oscillospiraceae bacterium]|nr:helix-turn-helix domain-containing protein [Oscillospiraceae bacterium]
MNIELGNKIKQLRLRKGITQDTLAKALNVSFQTVSKWENNISMPDIQILPEIAVYFGCTIDDLFNLSEQAQFERIENMMDMKESMSADEFAQAERFLKDSLSKNSCKNNAFRLLAELYNHKADEFRKIAELYAKEALELDPEVKQNHNNLQRAQEGTISDWDFANHSKRIAYYKDFVRKNPGYGRGYLYLMNELIADYRLDEAESVCEAMKTVDGSGRASFYQGKICWARGEHEKAESIWKQMLLDHSNDWLTYAMMADEMASVCRYDEAIDYYKKAFELQPSPKYIDAQITAAHIYEIQRNYDAAIASLYEQMDVLKTEWNITEGRELDRIHGEINRLRCISAK